MQSHRQLDDAGNEGVVDPTETAVSPSGLARIFVISVIQEVECFRPEVQTDALVQGKSLNQTQIEGGEPWAVRHVAL